MRNGIFDKRTQAWKTNGGNLSDLGLVITALGGGSFAAWDSHRELGTQRGAGAGADAGLRLQRARGVGRIWPRFSKSRNQGEGIQTTVNNVLRQYVETQRRVPMSQQGQRHKMVPR